MDSWLRVGAAATTLADALHSGLRLAREWRGEAMRGSERVPADWWVAMGRGWVSMRGGKVCACNGIQQSAAILISRHDLVDLKLTRPSALS